MDTLYVFIDESGNFDFSVTGTNHFVMSAVTVLSPKDSSDPLQDLKYELLENGYEIECFHAAPDLQEVRDKVFSVINTLTNIRVNYIYADKHLTHPSYQKPEKIYALFGKTLVAYIFNGQLSSQYEQVIVIFDKALTKKQEKAFLGVLKPALKVLGKRYYIYCHQTKSDFNAQIADYVAWAKYVELERNETRPIRSISGIEQGCFNIFRTGRRRYY